MFATIAGWSKLCTDSAPNNLPGFVIRNIRDQSRFVAGQLPRLLEVFRKEAVPRMPASLTEERRRCAGINRPGVRSLRIESCDHQSCSRKNLEKSRYLTWFSVCPTSWFRRVLVRPCLLALDKYGGGVEGSVLASCNRWNEVRRRRMTSSDDHADLGRVQHGGTRTVEPASTFSEKRGR